MYKYICITIESSTRNESRSPPGLRYEVLDDKKTGDQQQRYTQPLTEYQH